MKKATEKERKFLLKKMPNLKADRILNIYQFYKNGYRYRQTYDLNTNSFIYEKIKKVKVAKGHNEELEITELTYSEYLSESVQFNYGIRKMRYEFHFEDKKIEIDDFSNSALNLIIMEIEDVELDEEIKLPKEIRDVILMEVTGNEKFDNYNLAQ